MKSIAEDSGKREPVTGLLVERESSLTKPPLECCILEIGGGDGDSLVVGDGADGEVLLHFEEPRVNINRSGTCEVGRG